MSESFKLVPVFLVLQSDSDVEEGWMVSNLAELHRK